MCQTPQALCCGAKTGTSQSLNRKDSMKAHSSPEEAFKCYSNYLQSIGYERVGSREFRPPDGGPIEILTKKCRYGARLRRGKSELKGTTSSGVFMPAVRHGGIIKG